MWPRGVTRHIVRREAHAALTHNVRLISVCAAFPPTFMVPLARPLGREHVDEVSRFSSEHRRKVNTAVSRCCGTPHVRTSEIYEKVLIWNQVFPSQSWSCNHVLLILG